MSNELCTAKAIIELLMPSGIEVSSGFNTVGGFEIRATKCFSLNSSDYITLLAEPRLFAERVRTELGMHHKPKIVIQRVDRINTDYWASSPSARRKR